MKNELDSTILWELCNIAEDERVNFKKWFQDEVTTLESTQSKTYNLGIVPVTIHELMTVLPKTLLDPRPGVNKFYCIGTMWYSRAKVWQASYECLDETEHRDIYKAQTAPELVDALGKLLVLIIKEGWLG